VANLKYQQVPTTPTATWHMTDVSACSFIGGNILLLSTLIQYFGVHLTGLLFPQDLAFDQKIATNITIKHVASLTGCWTTFDPHVLSALSDHHVWTQEFLSTRLKWKPKQPITVMELRCSQLQQPLVIPTQDSYWGCFSWIDIEQGVTEEQLSTAEAVISDSDYQRRQQRSAER